MEDYELSNTGGIPAAMKTKYRDMNDDTHALVTSAGELAFNPVGSHSDGATISSALAIYTPSGANKIMIQALSQNVRYTLDGTTPTASLGFQLRAGDPAVIIPVGPDTTLTVIQEAATADLQYQWGA